MTPIESFDALSAFVKNALNENEGFTLFLEAEASTFIRFNKGKVRQAGEVQERFVTLTLLGEGKHASMKLGLSAEVAEDEQAIASALVSLREMLSGLDVDPFLLRAEVATSESVERSALPSPEEVIDDVCSLALGADLVGIYTGGTIVRAFACERGSRHVFEAASFHFDFSVFLEADKASKHTLSGDVWHRDEIAALIKRAKEDLVLLKRKPVTLAPGNYRAFLSPAALLEVFELMNHSAFSKRAQMSGRSSLEVLNGRSLSKRVTLVEQARGASFSATGFVREGEITLVEQGEKKSLLVSPYSGKEFKCEHTGASFDESPEALSMAAGDLASSDVLDALDEGLLISNLWYTNFSDRSASRLTGMTRFATFWVSGGEIVGPVNVMRFDDTFIDMFGQSLEALTKERTTFLDSSTYFSRGTRQVTLPGALLSSLTLTL